MKARRASAGAVCAVALAAGIVPAHALPSFEAVRAAHAPSDIPLLDRHGEAIQWIRVDASERRGPWLALAEMSPALREAVLLGEDRRFWQHSGVDWRALAASAWANAWNTRTRGASTVTMQLAGLLDERAARPGSGGRGLAEKASQLWLARVLEARWSKAEILEAYLNRVPLRGELVGIAAASQQLFGKHASGLDAIEGAVLAALVRSPNAGADTVARRACELRRLAAATAEATAAKPAPPAGSDDPCRGVATTAAQALARRPGPMLGEALAPHLARLMWREAREANAAHGGREARGARDAKIRGEPDMMAARPPELASTIDARLQRLALAALRRQLAELRGHEVEDGAAIVLDNATGEVLAWVGSVGSGSSAAEVDAVLARRQPGSTIKPFVYALALEKRLLTAASVLDDSPLQLAAGAGLYAPRNYDHRYHGAVTVRMALAGSLNVPAVRVASMEGGEALFERLVAAGLRPSHDAGHHGHALALGSADVALVDLANAYRMLARGGVLTPVRWRRGEGAAAGRRVASGVAASVGAGVATGAERRVFSPEASWLVADILADGSARAASFGFDSPLVTRGHAAVKTGTSKDMRDNWCLGFTDRYTVGVWVGNASGAAMHGVSGTSGAAPVWRELMASLHEGRPARAPAPPTGLRSVRGEWFIAGTEPAEGARPGAAAAFEGRASPFGIQAPRDGTVIVLDPEIPPAVQRLVLRGAPGAWSIDGQPVGRGARVEWLPRPGRHVLERRDAEGTDRVEFEVRAAEPPRRAAQSPRLKMRSTAASITMPATL